MEKSAGSLTSMAEQIDDLKNKIALFDGDRKAYYENSQWQINKNKNTIQTLRMRNKEARLELAKKKAGDEKVIDEAFQERDNTRHCAMRGMSGREAISKLDQQVCECKKKLNLTLHQQTMRDKKLKALQTEYDQMIKDAETVVMTDAGESKEAQQLRILENRLDKMNLKLNEANKIKTTYLQILEHQKEERRTWPKQLDALEQAIKQQNLELTDLHTMYNDAQVARDTAREELSKLEQSVYDSKRLREAQLNEYKKQAEEKKEHAEKVEKRLQRTSLQNEDLSHEHKSGLSGEEQERKITTFEEAMSKIKDATGVSDIQEVVQRFSSQGDTQKHLDQLKINNEKTLVRLKEEKHKHQNEFEEMKYSGEAKMSSGQRLLEEFQDRLGDKEKKFTDVRQRQEHSSRILVDVKAGVEHLADKLQHLKAPKGQVPQAQINPNSDEYVLDVLGMCEAKLLKLLEELGGRDIKDVMKEMEDTEFRATLESKLPTYNTRVKLPTGPSDRGSNAYGDDDEDSADDGDQLSRDNIKANSNLIVQSNQREKKPRKKEGKKAR